MLRRCTLETLLFIKSRLRHVAWMLVLLIGLGAPAYAAYSLTSIAVSSSTITLGQSITATAKLNGGGTATSITFTDGSVIGSCSVTVSTNADKTCTYTPSGTGTHTISAALASGGSVSTTFTVISPSLNLSPSSLSGGTVGSSYSATISATGGTAPYSFSTTAGTLPNGLSLSNAGLLSGTPTAAGTFNFTVTTSDGAITGNKSYSITVSKGTPGVTLGAAPASVTFGDTVTLTATMDPTTVSGTVTFYDGATSLGSGTLSSGVATLTTSTLSVATHTLTATYNGDTNWNSVTSSSASVTVSKIATTAQLSVSNSSPSLGTSITFTATVSPTSTGNVLFKDGGSTIATIALSSPTATFTTDSLTVGSHSITVEYVGDSTHDGSTSSFVSVNVSKIATQTTLQANPSSADVGGTITLTATVSPTATGSVQFKDGSTVLGSATLNGSSVATFSTSSLSIGSHTITAVYQGDATQESSTSSAVTVSINLIATSTTLKASATSVNYPGSVTFTATVSPGGSTGNVTFKDGATILGSVALSGGSASFTTNSLTPGSHSITATYVGDATHGTSTSNPVIVTARRPDPTLDPNVRGILSSQVQAVQRFASAQIGNVQQRLEQLHSDDVAPFSFGTGFVALDQSCRTSLELSCTATNRSQPMAYAGQEKSGSNIFSAFDRSDGNSAPMPAGNMREYSAFSLWSAGTVMFGHENLTAQPGDNRFSAAGLTVGLDTRLAPGMKLGAAFGFGNDRTDIANSYAFNKGNSASASIYASWRMFGSVYLDGLIGYGRVNFSSGRPSAFDGSWITGDRDARMTFGSVILTSEHKFDLLKLAPYTRLDLINANLKAYAEQGPVDWVLSYGDANKTSTSAVVGLRAQYDLLMGNGNVISPIMRLEYAHLFGGSLTQSIYYASDPSTQYGIALAPSASNTIAGSFGVKATGGNGVSGQVEYLLSGSTEGGVRGQGLRGLFKVAF